MQNKTINGYKIKHLIGSGGMADVYYAENSLGFPAAIKVLKQEYSQHQGVQERFVNEAKIMKKLNHPHIRKVMDMSDIDGRACIIMEYLEGQSLKEAMGDRKKMSDATLMKYFDQCAQALLYTHAMQVTHRDIKPSNIFITKDDEIKLVDFGIAKSELSESKTITGQTLGTVIYMSPEQVVDPKRVTGKTDIYSLGVTFYHVLTNKPPYDAKTGSEFTIQQKIVYEDLDVSFLPSHWRSLLSACLHKKPEERPSLKSENFKDGITVIDQVPPNPKPKPTPQPKPVPNPKPTSSYKWLYYLIGGIALAIAAMMGMRSCGGNGGNISTDLIVYEEDNMYGYKDASGTAVIPARYETASPFSGGRGKVSVADSVYYIDERGSIVELIKPKAETPTEDSKPDDTAAKDESAWQQAKKSNTKSAYERYIRDYPDGRYVSDAKSKIVEIEKNENAESSRKQDESAWQQAKSSNTKPAYERYIRDYANGKYVSEAKNKIRAIEAAEQKPQEQVSSSKPYIKMISIPGRSFKLSETEVTIGQYLAFCKATNSHWPEWLEKGNKYNIYTGSDNWYKSRGMSESNTHHPITGVSALDADAFCRWMGGRLPTESEWEYAAKGGESYEYAGSNNLDEVGWYSANSGGTAKRVKQLRANGYGLYDMSGNVWEWTSSKDGADRVFRGGSWINDASDCRVSSRIIISPVVRYLSLGFRLATSK